MEELLTLIALSIVVFAIIGFVVTIMAIVKHSSADRQGTQKKRSLQDDSVAAAYLINEFWRKQEIDDEQFDTLRKLLEENMTGQAQLPKSIKPDPVDLTTKPAVAPPISAAEETVSNPVKESEERIEPVLEATTESSIAKQPVTSPSAVSADVAAEVVAAEVVAEEVVDAAATVLPAKAPAPWDIPDPPEPKPRRTFSDVLANFMLDKNIRWGELASGILIVGSAIGLVISLRTQLTERIPYFPALLFLLITAAIHAAGSYTLRKWKLRNTSRGVLVIGLFMVPLNFLAACLLSEERPLSDPVYWIAMLLGFTAFTGMTWWSSKLLFRRGYGPFVASILGLSAMILVFNRLTLGESTWLIAGLTVPIGLLFLWGSGLVMPVVWNHRYWTERSLNRMYLYTGIPLFTSASAVSMLLVRSGDRTLTMMALTPLVMFLSLMLSWFGLLIVRNRNASVVLNHQLVHRSLVILGMSFASIAWLASVILPSVFLLNSLLLAVMSWSMARQYQINWLRPIAGFGLATAFLVAINALLGELDWNKWESLNTLGNALFSSQSGLTLMGLGGALAGCFSLQAMRGPGKGFDDFNRTDIVCAAGIGISGCVLSLVAGLIHRDSVFDTMTASLLLALAAVVTLVLAAIEHRQRWWVHTAALVSLSGLAFSTFWNPTIIGWIISFEYGYTLNWMVMVVVFSLMFSLAAMFASARQGAEAVTGKLACYAGFTASIASFMGLYLSARWPQLGVGLAVAGCLFWLGVAWSMRGKRSQFSEPPFVASTAVLIIAILMGFSESLGVPKWTEAAHWLVQCSVLGVWAIVWMLASRFANQGNGRFGWLLGNHPYRGEQIVLALVVGTYSLLLLVPLVELTSRQLYKTLDLGLYDGQGELGFLVTAYFSVFAASLIAFWGKPSTNTGSYLVLGWVLGWSLFAFGFAESVSVGSALRWLLSLSCLVTAGGVVYLMHRTKNLTDQSWISRCLETDLVKRANTPGEPNHEVSLDTEAATLPTGPRRKLLNQLINQFLWIAGGTVLLISSLTVAGVMLNGADSLGGPQPGSWFSSLPSEVSYGVPAVLLTSSLLVLSIALGRKWLTVFGSATYQYVVVFMVILLFLSPHPKLATSWFLSILQSVSIGMSLYGFVWFAFRNRIAGGGASAPGRKWISQLELHTLVNALLVTSLAVLIGGQVCIWPDQSGGWANAAGSPLGFIALLMVSGLGYVVGRDHKFLSGTDLLNGWLIAWVGLTFSAMLAALLDTNTQTVFIGIRTLVVGGVVTSLVLFGKMAFELRKSSGTPHPINVWPLLVVTSLLALFAFRASLYDPMHVWAYVSAVGLAVILVTLLGILRDLFAMQYVGAAYGITAVSMLILDVFDSVLTSINVGMIMLLLISCAWSVGYILKPERRQRPGIEFLLVNAMLVLSCTWVALMSAWQLLLDWEPRISDDSGLFRPAGIGFLAASLGCLVLTTWNRGVRLFLVTRYVWILGLVGALISFLLELNGATLANRILWISFGAGALVLGWGVVWATRKRWLSVAESWRIPRLAEIQNELRYKLPVYVLLTGCLVFFVSWLAIWNVAARPSRYLASLTPFLVVIGVGALSDSHKRRWMQVASLLMVTASLILVALADLPVTATSAQWLVRVMLVLAAMMFIYGGLVSRWSQANDSWLRSLREMASVTCALALPCLVLLVIREFSEFDKTQGAGIPLVDSVGVAIAVLGMIVGLITIAVRPKLDPFAMSVQGRTIYVYLAQVVVVLLCLHLYFTIPWLFQLGLAQFWPYLLIAIAFGGIGVSRLLQQRQLAVLAQPLFNTAAALPVLVSLGVFMASDTQADTSVVLLGAGLLYLMLSYTQRSVISGGVAIVLGNLALWVFYNKFPSFSFFEHPQLWLIPPAISVLVAAQLLRRQMSSSQLATLRYVCLATIYISSTSDIFIGGIGKEILPPIILALLSVIGILSGIGFRIRAFLYLGTLFLLLSMVAMVYHAQQALHHTWPWWAFGICMGIAILSMFGLFEKRRNKMKQIAAQLQQWDL